MFSSPSTRLHPVRRVAFAALLAAGVLTATSASANAAVVYDNVPSPLAGNYFSHAFQAQQTSEFGGQIRLAGTQRQDPSITVTMSSWGCQRITAAVCDTDPGATFTHPITVNLYSVLPNGEPGGQIASVTNTATIPYRPSTDPTCGPSGNPAGGWRPTGSPTCFSGIASNVTFDLSGRGITLPDRVIVALAYQTSNYGKPALGAQPCGATPQGCPYDSLNVGLQGPPTVGTTPRPDDAYIDATNDANDQYCNDAGPVDVFRLSAGCWFYVASGDLRLMVEVDATTTGGPPGLPGTNGTNGTNGANGANGATGPAGADGASGGVAGVVVKKCKKGKKLKKGKCVRKKKK